MCFLKCIRIIWGRKYNCKKEYFQFLFQITDQKFQGWGLRICILKSILELNRGFIIQGYKKIGLVFFVREY